MNNFELYLNRYGLHDTFINKVVLTNNGVEFVFREGVYLLDSTGKMTNKTDTCTMDVYICDFDKDSIYQHVEVRKIFKNKIAEIEFKEFLKLLNKNSFKIYLDWYSFFANSMLLTGSIGRYEIEIKITEIEKFFFAF